MRGVGPDGFPYYAVLDVFLTLLSIPVYYYKSSMAS
jgi:hypothetical protein